MDHTKVSPLRNSVKARAIKPNIANLPFHISASEDMILWDLDSTLTPWTNGIKEARERSTLVPKNHGIPPLDICVNTSWPLASSTAIAATNPIMANLPLILSGAGPLNANKSENLVLTFGERVGVGVVDSLGFSSLAMERTLRLAWVLRVGMYLAGMAKWLTLDLLVIGLASID